MRCKACNRMLEDEDISSIRYTDDTGIKHYEDMCSWCRDEAYGTFTYVTDKRYVFEELETNLEVLQEKA